MNLETGLDPRLWTAVRMSFEARKFSSAVLDAIHLLTDVIRERSGLDGDGVALIGQAFGGTTPKLKVSKLQTESEQNVQRGVEAMLRGLYQAIRNPRSHESHEDNERDATALILFVDYLLRVVDKSGSPFSLAKIIARVLDPDFMPTQRYAELLVGEIPLKKRLATCMELFARHKEADNPKIKFFFASILPQLATDDYDAFCKRVSEELRETDDDATIRFVVSVFPPDMWPKLDEVARLRIENKFIGAIREGRYNKLRERLIAGALGTWVTSILGHLTLRRELWLTVMSKLESPDITSQNYVFRYLLHLIPDSYPSPPEGFLRHVLGGLEAGDIRYKVLVEYWAFDLFEPKSPDDPWVKPFAEALANFQEKQESPSEPPPPSGDPDIPF